MRSDITKRNNKSLVFHGPPKSTASLSLKPLRSLRPGHAWRSLFCQGLGHVELRLRVIRTCKTCAEAREMGHGKWVFGSLASLVPFENKRTERKKGLIVDIYNTFSLCPQTVLSIYPREETLWFLKTTHAIVSGPGHHF